MRFKAVTRCPYLLVAFFCFGMMFSCEYASGEPVIIPYVDTTVITSFSNDIMPVFLSCCTVCHHGSHSVDLTKQSAYSQFWTDGPNAPYMDTTDTEASIQCIRMNSNTNQMYTAGKLSSDKISLVLNWITRGAKNN